MFVQAVCDIMAHMDRIWRKYKRSVLDYAVFFRERHQAADTYEEYMSLVTCHCIVHADFLSPDVAWEVVPFL